jgi:hypothetical protein
VTSEIRGQAPFVGSFGHFDSLIGDKRTSRTFSKIARGIIAAGGLVCQRIAAHSPVLSVAKD